jgi:hypothetical protein
MKMTSNIKIIIAVLMTGVLVSCSKNFEELNNDPNRLEAVRPGTLLAPAQYYSMWAITNRAHRIHNELMQYSVETGSLNDFARYDFRENEFDYLWTNLYKRANDMQKMYQLAEPVKDVNNMAVALVMKAWLVSNLTDMFGDIPYTDAFKGDEELYYPKFDNQKSIYENMLADLKRANDLFKENVEFDGTDLIYNNDVLKWKKFTNALRLRLLMRLSNKPEMDVKTQIAEIFNDPVKYPLFESNDDEAMMKHTGVSPFINTFSTWRTTEFSGNRRIGKPLMDLLNTTVDGRRFRYATKNSAGAYVGIPSGYTQPETYTFSQNGGAGSSTYAATLQNENYPFPILTYAEVMFNLSEAALKGWISASAETYYNKGIEASWRQWDCTWDGTAGTTYLARSTVKFNNTMERLMSQKYIALFFNGFEAWYEYRRTGFPNLPIGPAVSNDGILPRRLEYPLIVKATNKNNYNEVAARIGGDNLKTKVWWDNK